MRSRETRPFDQSIIRESVRQKESIFARVRGECSACLCGREAGNLSTLTLLTQSFLHRTSLVLLAACIFDAPLKCGERLLQFC